MTDPLPLPTTFNATALKRINTVFIDPDSGARIGLSSWADRFASKHLAHEPQFDHVIDAGPSGSEIDLLDDNTIIHPLIASRDWQDDHHIALVRQSDTRLWHYIISFKSQNDAAMFQLLR